MCFLETKHAQNPGLFHMFPFPCVSTSTLWNDYQKPWFQFCSTPVTTFPPVCKYPHFWRLDDKFSKKASFDIFLFFFSTRIRSKISSRIGNIFPTNKIEISTPMPPALSASQLSQDPNWNNDGVLDEEPDAEQPDFNFDSVRSVVNAASESVTHN